MVLILSVKLVKRWMAKWHKLPPVITFRMTNSISYQFPVSEVVLEGSGGLSVQADTDFSLRK